MTRAQALATKRAAVPWRRGFLAVAVLGVAGAMVGCFVHPVVPVAVMWLLIAGGLALAALGAAGARSATAAMRYRVTNGPVLLVFVGTMLLASAAAVAWFSGAGAWAAPRGAATYAPWLLLLVVQLVQLAIMLNMCSLFDGDADGVRFVMRGRRLRRTRIAWEDVEAIVLTTCARPDRVEISVRTRSGAPPFAQRRIIVAAKRVSLDGLGWMMNQSGRDDIALLSHTAAGVFLLGYANAWARSIARYPSATPDPAAA